MSQLGYPIQVTRDAWDWLNIIVPAVSVAVTAYLSFWLGTRLEKNKRKKVRLSELYPRVVRDRIVIEDDSGYMPSGYIGKPVKREDPNRSTLWLLWDFEYVPEEDLGKDINDQLNSLKEELKTYESEMSEHYRIVNEAVDAQFGKGPFKIIRKDGNTVTGVAALTFGNEIFRAQWHKTHEVDLTQEPLAFVSKLDAWKKIATQYFTLLQMYRNLESTIHKAITGRSKLQDNALPPLQR